MIEAIAWIQGIILIGILALLIGLLRSHAETLRRLEDLQRSRSGTPRLPVRTSDRVAALDIMGQTLAGGTSSYALSSTRQDRLVAFLSSGCLTCQDFWAAFKRGEASELPGNVQLMIVTKDRSVESPSKLTELAPDPKIPLVMSSQAWSDFEVPSSPYFIYVSGESSEIAGEGSATTWSQVLSLFRDALMDAQWDTKFDFSRFANEARRGPILRGNDNVSRDNAVLATAGIEPGDPSLYEAASEREPLDSEGPREHIERGASD